MGDHPQYSNPPLTELVFEVFYESEAWTPVITGILFSELKSKYPELKGLNLRKTEHETFSIINKNKRSGTISRLLPFL